MVQHARLFLFNSPALEHVAYEDYHVAEKGLVVLSMMPGTNSEAHENKQRKRSVLIEADFEFLGNFNGNALFKKRK